MKNMRKLASLLLALVMVFSLAGTAFAASVNENDDAAVHNVGKITIENAVVGETYKIYRIFDLVSFDDETVEAPDESTPSGPVHDDSNSDGLYAYVLNADWAPFFEAGAAGADYITVNEDGYVEWVDGKSAADFAAAAIAFAQDSANAIAATQTANGVDSNSVTFEKLTLGYYLLDSSLGSLCSLNTTNPNAIILEKNHVPTNEKTVKEDSTNIWGKTNNADMQQTVNFHSTITVQRGAENYVLHDMMTSGLTFQPDSVLVKIGDTQIPAAETIPATETEPEKTITNWTLVDYSSNTDADKAVDGCTFEVVFDNAFILKQPADTKIVVAYAAILNENAVVGDTGNSNSSRLSYGEANSTQFDVTTTYTWEINVFKYDLDEATGDKNALADAQFVLYKSETMGTDSASVTIQYYATVANGKVTGWTAEEDEATILESGDDGKFKVEGLDSDTYFFQETKAPAGYNLLKTPVEFTIDNEGKVWTKGEVEGSVTDVEEADKEIEIENKAGTQLPSTGGMGTTMFYVIGAILMLGAVVLLITKRRMNA